MRVKQTGGFHDCCAIEQWYGGQEGSSGVNGQMCL